MTASAQIIPLADKAAAKSWGKIRPGWQAEAWAYRRNLGELRYATAYLGNSSMRIRLFPATYLPGDEVPKSLDMAPEIPQDLKMAAQETLLRLAQGGPLALSMMQKKMTENFEVAGESYLIGETDPLTGLEAWTLRSTSELVVNNSGEVKILEFPGATAGDARTLDPEHTFVSRLWWPDPEWGMLADSPFRSILDLCEELLLLGKDVRATARSRLALNGILGIPDSLSIIGSNPEAPLDPNQDPFWQTLIETVTSALTNEGSAAAVVPLLLRGPAEALAAIKHIQIERPTHEKNIEQRQELISRIATGLDLPAEVLTGKADLNHWTAWQVDDDAFRHHIEPIQVVQNDAFTAGFLWPMLDAYNTWDPALIRKILIWHDPTELLTHPDRADDAFKAWDRFAISDGALRKYLGFPIEDEPNSTELLTRIVTKAKTLDPALVETILRRLDPTLPKPTPANPTTPQAAIGAPPDDSTTPTQGPPPIGGGEAASSAATQYAIEALAQGVAKFYTERGDRERIAISGPKERAAIVAAAAPKASAEDVAASRKMIDIDRELRTKLHVAANQAIKRALEKAGAKVVSKARGKGNDAIRASLAGVPTHRVCAAVGPALIAALGLDAKALSDAEFAELKVQWDRWVSESSDQALRQAARIAGVDSSAMKAQVGGRLADDAEAGWAWLEERMQGAVAREMSGAVGEAITVNAEDSFLSMGEVRGALAVAGGFTSDPTSAGITVDGQPVDRSEAMGQLATGDTIGGAMADNGVQDAGYVWVHGPSSNPFEPHLELDGTEFATFDAEVLANDDSFPDYDYFAPGDHSGCSCDFMPVYIDASSPDSGDGSGDGSGDNADASGGSGGSLLSLGDPSLAEDAAVGEDVASSITEPDMSEFEAVTMRGSAAKGYPKMDKAFSDWSSGLTSSERQGLSDYGNNAFGPINATLRSGGTFPEKSFVNPTAGDLKTLDSAIASGSAPENLMVYRGMSSELIDTMAAQGGSIVDAGYGSTSLDVNIAQGFSTGRGANVIGIEVPKGTPMAWMKVGNGSGEEAEALLGRGGSYNYVGLNAKTNLPTFRYVPKAVK